MKTFAERKLEQQNSQAEKALDKLADPTTGRFARAVAEASLKQADKANAKDAIRVINTRGGVASAILKAERDGYTLTDQRRSSTGKTCLTFRRVG